VAAGKNAINHKTVTFRQGNQCHWVAHHNALEFPDGKVVANLSDRKDQQVTVLQDSKVPQRLPAFSCGAYCFTRGASDRHKIEALHVERSLRPRQDRGQPLGNVEGEPVGIFNKMFAYICRAPGRQTHKGPKNGFILCCQIFDHRPGAGGA